jgi:hypothetical protein
MNSTRKRSNNRDSTPPDSLPPADSPALFGLVATDGPEVDGDGHAALPQNGDGPAEPPDPPGVATVAPSADDDPFNPKRLRLTQDFASAVGVRKVLTTVPVRKPAREWWVRTHPDPDYRLETAVLELQEDRETYLVDPALWPELASEPAFSPRLLIAGVNRQGVAFLWPIKLPGPDGKIIAWHRSALDAAEQARSAWTRVYADMSLGAYRVEVAPALGRFEPAWPDLPMGEWLRIAFRDKFITAGDHPTLRQLRGEV